MIKICEHIKDISNTVSEQRINQAPSLRDLEEMRALLKEFEIEKVNFPSFKTYGELQRWKRLQILHKLKN